MHIICRAASVVLCHSVFRKHRRYAWMSRTQVALRVAMDASAVWTPARFAAVSPPRELLLALAAASPGDVEDKGQRPVRSSCSYGPSWGAITRLLRVRVRHPSSALALIQSQALCAVHAIMSLGTPSDFVCCTAMQCARANLACSLCNGPLSCPQAMTCGVRGLPMCFWFGAWLECFAPCLSVL
jgi:hypothetical protein